MDRDRAALVDIVIASRAIASFIDGLEQSEFLASPLVTSAVIRQLEIIGEAVKRLSESAREAYPQVPWKQMAGLRDRLIHAYDQINLERIWAIATQDVPPILALIEPDVPGE